ncbi:hypothetical protein D0Z03_000622 [Geotrichum reessii]|nr:hypothetical protein D0Z03_000622 [Galactomyces reessii]
MSIIRKAVVLRPICRSFATTAQLLAKGDESTIDFYKLPPSNYVPVNPGPSIKIPILPDNYSTSGRAPEPVKSKLTSKFNEPLVSEVTDQGTVSSMTDADILATTKAGGPTKAIPTEESFESAYEEEPIKLEQLSENDKTTLWSIFGVVTAWWLIGSIFDGSSKNKDSNSQTAKH